jgi:hypothetical protein
LLAGILGALTLFVALSSSGCSSSDALGSTDDENNATRATFNVMGPLVVGDPDAPRDDEGAWRTLHDQLLRAKALGAMAVSTDVWWGLVERDGDQRFRWDYYDRLSDEILAAGLKWVPILSFHQCGGNVGDTCDIPIPGWLGEKYANRRAVASPDDIFYRSEQGHTSREVLSVWSTPVVIDDYRELMEAFQEHFAAKASRISEINISLGPAGELRYPSYNAHDRGAGYPTRGTLQAYSALAVESFRKAVLDKYGSVDAASRAWGTRLGSAEDLGAPSDAEGFFARNEPFTAYGRDFFTWYQGSLLAHGRQLLATAVAVFDGARAPFEGIEIGGKVPGVHWRMASDRYAELAAGMLRTEDADGWSDDRTGHGYAPIVSVFEDSKRLPRAPRVVLHFTCLEKADGEDGPSAGSLAKSLVFWVGAHASSRGVVIKGENALAGALATAGAWDNMADALAHGHYRGLTVLRVDDVVNDATPRDGFGKLVKRFAR